MEVKIAVKGVARELIIDTEQDADEIIAAVRAAIEDAAGILDLTDAKGRRVLVPSDKVAYVELGSTSRGRVGFGA